MTKKEMHYVCVNPMICNKYGYQPSAECAVHKCKFSQKREFAPKYAPPNRSLSKDENKKRNFVQSGTFTKRIKPY